MPVFAGLYLIVVMGSAGLPALSGFVGEFLTLFGTFNANDPVSAVMKGGYHLPQARLLGALATTGVIFGAVYLLYMFQKVFFGKLDKARNGHLKDLNGRERSVQKFTDEFGKHVAEPDCAVHLYTTGCPTQNAAIQKNLDAMANGADGVQKAINAGGQP
jgi:NADH:ubiquinone oxidoreductase subunit 5 (subunit L)/multisubunit Na+/H+ antiporter MnhA subunit